MRRAETYHQINGTVALQQMVMTISLLRRIAMSTSRALNQSRLTNAVTQDCSNLPAAVQKEGSSGFLLSAGHALLGPRHLKWRQGLYYTRIIARGTVRTASESFILTYREAI